MRPEGVAPSESFVWQAAGIGVSAELSCAVLSAIRAQLQRAEEFGGILLGTCEGDGEVYRTRVEAFEPFQIEHRYGLGFSLSIRDQKRLRHRIERLGRGRQRPVGMFRTHLRRGLYLDQRDFELFSGEFRTPAAVFLLVRADEAEAARGALFAWEGSDIRRHASYLEFAIGGTEAQPQVWPAPASKGPVVTARERPVAVEEAPRAAARMAPAPAAPRRFAPDPPAASVPIPIPVPAPAAIPPTAARSGALVERRDRKGAVVVALAESFTRASRAVSQFEPRIRGALAHVPPARVRAAGVVIASIVLPLTTFYVGRAVGMREQKDKTKAAAQVAKAERRHALPRRQPAVESKPTPPPPALSAETLAEPEPFRAPEPDEGGEGIQQAASNYRERSVLPVRAPVHKPRIWRGAPAAPASWTSAAPALPDPPAVSARTAMPQIPKLVMAGTSARSRPAKRVVAYIKPSESFLRKVPLLRAFARSREDFVPANPLEHPLPAGAAAADSEGADSVELAAKIDRSGKVIRVKTLEGSDELARTSAEVLYRWTFEPARQNGEAVESEMLVRFEFTEGPQ